MKRWASPAAPDNPGADRGSDSDALRQQLRRRGIRHCIPFQRNRKPRRGRKPDLQGYRDRWRVERTFAWLGNFPFTRVL